MRELEHWSYVAMLVFCLAGTLPLIPAFRLRVLRQPRRLLLTVLAAGAPFLVWDLYASSAGHWRFDEAQTLPWRVAGLPLEEIAFFVVIPLVTVLTYEGVRAARDRDGRGGPARRREGVDGYTAIAVLAVLLAIALDRWGARTRLTTSGTWLAAYAIIVFFQLLTNGWLTGRGIVRYDPDAIIGSSRVTFVGDGRLVYAPVEDLGFGFALVLTTSVVWVWLGRRSSEDHG